MLTKPSDSEPTRCANTTRTFRSTLIALCLLPCAACLPKRLPTPTPALQANLKALCPPLPQPESLDPARLEWELKVVAQYGDCAERHRRTVEAWPNAKPKEK
ncbi:hypothetical protein [Caulobacter phage RLK]|nr:hypothetical protein RW_GP071c [Caulobacter phage RW]WCD56310.1 hypothetical protein [Caulobacter phage RLK]WNV48102.1 hypothetical protein GB2A_gp070c [Caulobacter phage GB2A]